MIEIYLDKSLGFLKKSDISIGIAWQNIFSATGTGRGYFLSAALAFSSDKPSIRIIVDGVTILNDVSPGFLSSADDLDAKDKVTGFISSLGRKGININFPGGIKVKDSFKIQAKSGGGTKTLNAAMFTYYLSGTIT